MNLGLVVKQPNENDKRSHFLQLTDNGLGYSGVLGKIEKESLYRKRDGICDANWALFLEIGEKMVANLDAYNQR